MLRRGFWVALLSATLISFPAFAAMNCPAGAVETTDPSAGLVCRYEKSGLKLVAPDDAGHCPDGFRLDSYRGEVPLCMSMAMDDSRAGSMAPPLITACKPGMAPIFNENGDLQCRRNDHMRADKIFHPPEDCPGETKYVIRNLVGGCLPR